MDQNANLRKRLENQGAGGGRRRSHGKGDGGSGKGGAGGNKWFNRVHDDAPAGVPPPPLPAEGAKRSAGMEAWSKRRANKQARKGGGKGGK